MELRGKKVLVVGLARTGLAAARFCFAQGARVTVNDARDASSLAPVLAGLPPEIARNLGGHPPALFSSQDLIVLSPGVPPSIDALVFARNAGVEIVSEIELAARHITVPVIAVTGTNGKTTTTTMIGDVLSRAGHRVFVGGNIGDPLVGAVTSSTRFDIVVAEVSSFQLEATSTFAPKVGVHLNLTPDHLDRYASMEAYALAKERLFAFQRADQHALVNADDPYASRAARASRATTWPFSSMTRVDRGAYLESEYIVLRVDAREERFDARARRVLGRHNLSNLMVMALCARLCGVARDAIEGSIVEVTAPPHRLELVRERGAVRYFNDSKATNVDSVLRSLESITAPIHLIAGGRHKGASYAPLRALVTERVRAIYLVGEAAPLLRADLGDVAPCHTCGDLATAVARASKDAVPGDVVLLSPACASYDQFRDFEERGERFRTLVEALP
jgi:UDP-N-acetylmuramoylalanine--D-glutamate ligase